MLSNSYPGGGTETQQSISLINVLLVWIMTRIEVHMHDLGVVSSGEVVVYSVINQLPTVRRASIQFIYFTHAASPELPPNETPHRFEALIVGEEVLLLIGLRFRLG
jgi:hypothetical protein